MNYYTFRTIQIVLTALFACCLVIVVTFIIASHYKHQKQKEQWMRNKQMVDSIMMNQQKYLDRPQTFKQSDTSDFLHSMRTNTRK